MQISITFRHMEPREDIKDYAREKLQRLEKYVDSLMEIQVIFTQEKHRNRIDVLLKADGLSIAGHEETADIFSSVDAVVDNLERQLKKQKSKMAQKQKNSPERRTLRVKMDIISSEGGDESLEPQIIVSRSIYPKPMSLEEAVMQLRLSDNEFLVFTDSATERINVLYRRKDGNFGLIEPEIQ